MEKRCLSSLDIRETQIKNIKGQQNTVKIFSHQKQTLTNTRKNVGKMEHS